MVSVERSIHYELMRPGYQSGLGDDVKASHGSGESLQVLNIMFGKGGCTASLHA